MEKNELAAALEGLAEAVKNDATTIIGSQVSVTVDRPFSGTIIGESTTVTVGPGATGNIIGRSTSVTVSGPIEMPLVFGELQEAAKQVRAGITTMDNVKALVARVKDLGFRTATEIAASLLAKLVVGA